MLQFAYLNTERAYNLADNIWTLALEDLDSLGVELSWCQDYPFSKVILPLVL